MQDHTARDVMTSNLITVDQHLDLRTLAKTFLSQGITGAPVVDEDGRLIGVVSQTDLIHYSLSRDDELVMPSDFYQNAKFEGSHLPQGFQIEDTNSGQVRDIMTPVIYVVDEETPVADVARMLIDQHIHRVIVVRGDRAVGMISALDLLGELVGAEPIAAEKTP